VELALIKADTNAAIPRDRAARLALLRRGLIPWLAGIDPNTGSPRRRVARMAEVPQEARPLIELMVEQRLLATDIDSATKEQTIEPAHEALLRQWGALDGWLVEDSADLSTIEALRRAASEWDANARASEFIIHRGARLQSLEQVAAGEKFAAYLTSIDRAYLSASRNVENEAVKKARAARTRWGIAAAIAGVVLVAGATAGYFVWSAGEAAKIQSAVNFEIARAEAALREGRPEEAAKAAMSAYGLLPSTETRTSALTAALSVSSHAIGVVGIEGRIVDTAWLDPSRLAILNANGQVTLFDGSARTVGPASVIDPAPLPIALVADGNGSAVVIRADTSFTGLDGSLLVAPPADSFSARSGRSAVGANGKVAAFVGLIGDVLVRDWRQLPVQDHLLAEADAPVVGVTPDGKLVGVARGLGVLALYSDAEAGPTISSYGRNFAQSMAWSHAQDILAISDGVGQISLLDAHDPTRTLASINSAAKSSVLQWSPVADLLATACFDSDVCVYDAAGALIERFSGHIGQIASIHWSPDGRLLASTAAAEPVRIWSLAPDASAHMALRSDETIALLSLAVDPASGRIAVGDELGRIGVWTGDKFSHRLARPDIFPGLPPPGVTSLAFLGDGRLAAVYQGRGVAIWTLGQSAPDKVVPLENLSFSRIAALTGDIRAAVPLSDKTILVFSGDELRESRIAADAMPLDQWGLVAAAEANSAYVSYSDGSIRRRDLGAGGEGTVIFDAARPSCGVGPSKDNNGAKSLAFSADGKWLVATRTDSMVIVHNLADPKNPLCLALPTADSKTVAFSADSKRLAVLSATDRLYVFDLAHPDRAEIYGAPALATASAGTAPGAKRLTSWMAWLDSDRIAVSTAEGTVEIIRLDPAGWRARVDSLFLTP
ncbi:MAG: hypothetical protein ABIQ30_17630, partial [Devosia sp.]